LQAPAQARDQIVAAPTATIWEESCNGTPAQQWVYTSGRDLVNPQVS
jgi:hypothetical protein